MLETNKHPRSVCNIIWGGGGRGATTDEIGVYIQIQNIIVSSKALVLVNCLNTFVHDCRFICDTRVMHTARINNVESLLRGGEIKSYFIGSEVWKADR